MYTIPPPRLSVAGSTASSLMDIAASVIEVLAEAELTIAHAMPHVRDYQGNPEAHRRATQAVTGQIDTIRRFHAAWQTYSEEITR